MLNRIALKPTYGYEILTEIEEKTEGTWRPGPGSVYPLLKKLVSEGYVEVEAGGRAGAEKRKYRATSKGMEHLSQAQDTFRMMNKRMAGFRGLMVDMIGPDRVGSYMTEGAERQLDLSRKVLEANKAKIPPEEMNRILREYAVGLERQLDWTNKLLRETAGRSRYK